MDRILFQVFKIILYIFKKKHGEKTDNPSIRIFVNKVENISRYYRELLMHVTMELLGSTKNKTTKDETGKNVPHLEIIEVVLVYCNIVNDDYQQDSRHLYTFVPNNSLG